MENLKNEPCSSNCTCDLEKKEPCLNECDCKSSSEETCICEEEQVDKKKNKKKKDKHLDKLNEAYNMISTLEDKLLREKAEAINFRKRKEEETGKLLKYCNESLVKEILPIVDNLERAIDMEDEHQTEEMDKFLTGFKMIYCNLVSTLEKYEVKAIDGKNKPFDPAFHQAVMTEKVEDMETGMIVEVLQKGYLLKDRVIRPAMVKVSE